MQYKFEYTDVNTRELLINSNSTKVLIEEQMITEGNFLIFSDEKPLVGQLQELNNTSNMILLKQEGIL